MKLKLHEAVPVSADSDPLSDYGEVLLRAGEGFDSNYQANGFEIS